jgi:hypothetical protein
VPPVARFVDGSVNACAVSYMGFMKIPVAGCRPLGQLAAFVQQRIRHVYRRQRPAPLPSCTAKSRYQQQLGADGGLRRPPVLRV